MIDVYKRVLVGQYAIEDEEKGNLLNDNDLKEAAAVKAGINPDLLEYGTKAACITEYYITDSEGIKTTAVIKGMNHDSHEGGVFTGCSGTHFCIYG
nr:hypothetical protein [Kineothrix alysoides]